MQSFYSVTLIAHSMSNEKPQAAENNYTFEITRHTLHFHDNASIYGLCSTKNHLFTAGSDCTVRCWHIALGQKKSQNGLYYPDNTSVSLSYCSTLTLPNSTSAIRSYENYILAGSVNGEIVLYKENNCKFEECTIRSGDGDGVNEICFVRTNVAIFGFESGRAMMYEIIENNDIKHEEKPEEIIVKESAKSDHAEEEGKEKHRNNANKKKRINPSLIKKGLTYKLLTSIKIHPRAIQGLSYDPVYNILATFSKTRSAKLYYVTNKLVLLNTMNQIFADEQELILFKKFCFSHDGEFLYTGGINGKKLNIYYKPFGEKCGLGTVGPFEAHVSVIYEYGKRNLCNLKHPDHYKNIDGKKEASDWASAILEEENRLNNYQKNRSSMDLGPDEQTSQLDAQGNDQGETDCNIYQHVINDNPGASCSAEMSGQGIINDLQFPQANNIAYEEICETESALLTSEEEMCRNRDLSINAGNLQEQSDINRTPTEAEKENEQSKAEIAHFTDTNELDLENISQKIKNVDNLIFFAVKNNLYCMNREEIIFKMENICYRGITDITVVKDVVFVSSVDGLLSSVRFLN